MVIKRSLIKLGQHLQPPWSQSPGRKCQVKQSLLSRLAELIKFSLNIQRGKWISFSWRALPPPLSFEIYFHHVYLQEKKTDGQNIHSQASNESLGIGPWTFRGPLSMHGWGLRRAVSFRELSRTENRPQSSELSEVSSGSEICMPGVLS